MKTKLFFRFALLSFFSFLITGFSYSQCTFSGLSPNYCTNSLNSTLTTTVLGGNFSGPGVVGSVFTPSVAGPGTHTITLTGSCTAYVITTPSFAPSTTLGANVSLGDDQESGILPIGFTFNYFCTPYTNFYISSNGFIEFALTGQGCCAGQTLPNFTNPSNLVAYCWTDLNPGTGGSITYTTIGISPNRTLVVSFNAIPYYSSGNGPITSQIKLFETTNSIEIHSTTVPANTSYARTNGIENSGGTIASVVPGRNATSTWTATNECYRFTPGYNCLATQTTVVSPSTISVVGSNSICAGATTTLVATGNTTYTWSTASNSDSITASPSVTTTYSVAGTNSFGCVANSAITVTVDNTPTISVASTPSTGGTCPNSTVVLTAGGATSYTWTGGVLNGIPFAPTVSGVYSVTGENACGTASASISVSIHPLPTVSGIASSPTICSGNPVSLTGVGN
ncbi:MAG: hypothetical protein PSX36_08525, partial [bacterium]|nr:hypothetical protein [bacterium]